MIANAEVQTDVGCKHAKIAMPQTFKPKNQQMDSVLMIVNAKEVIIVGNINAKIAMLLVTKVVLKLLLANMIANALELSDVGTVHVLIAMLQIIKD